MGKEIVCACEDVTREELRRALRAGVRDVESLKRLTGFGTGPCQGKSCVSLVLRELAALGARPGELAGFTARPPASPIALGVLAALEPEAAAARSGRAEADGEPPSPDRSPPERGERGEPAPGASRRRDREELRSPPVPTW